MANRRFEEEAAKECARAFSAVTGFGALLSTCQGQPLASYGTLHCGNCQLCTLQHLDKGQCTGAQLQGMAAAERFGGKYVYLCPAGLTCLVCPVFGEDTVEAMVTVGPVLMGERGEFWQEELLPRLHPEDSAQQAQIMLDQVPEVSPQFVEDVSLVLFMALGFINNLQATSAMLELQASYDIQKQISAHFASLKDGGTPPPYPFEAEHNLLESVAHLDRKAANQYLNELFSYIFFAVGNDLQLAKSRITELLILMSRTAIANGGDAQTLLTLTHGYLQAIPKISGMDELCLWLTKVMNRLMDNLFEYGDVKHVHEIHKAVQFIRANHTQRITLDSVAQEVYLSPTYFSRIFRQETGLTFNGFLNKARVDHSKKLLSDKAIRLVDIPAMVGFESQSYFTKVFKKVTGQSPLQFRESHYAHAKQGKTPEGN